MNRRQLLTAATMTLIGCETRSAFRESTPMRSIDYRELIAARATAAAGSTDPARLDPATIALVAGLIWDLLRYCFAANIRRQWERLNAHHDGLTARRLKQRLTEQIIEQQPDADPDQIAEIVGDHLAAFRQATRAEIDDMIEAAAARNVTERVDWEAAKRSSELMEVAP